MSKLSISILCLASVASLLFLSPSILLAHGASYTPALTPGQWAEYKVVVNSCFPSGSPACQAQATGGLGMSNTDYGVLNITNVSGTNVTITLFTAYTNGTSAGMQGWVDVASGGSSLVGLAGGAPSNYFVLAGGLQATDGIWNTINAPAINQTTTESVLGQSRQVNILNYTHTTGSAYGSFTLSTQFTFDRMSGILFAFSISTSSSSTYGGSSQTVTTFSMIANNIWRSDTLPSFTISNGGSISVQAGLSGTTTLTLSAQNGFDSTVNLQATTQAGLTCTFDKTSIRGSGTVTLSCAGQPGSYTVTVTATSGGTVRHTQVPVQINTAATPNQPTNQSTLIYIVIGVAAALAVATLAGFLVLRRKEEKPHPASTEAPPPPTTT